MSGGPDSLALLLLAHHALPDQVEAATVDHGLRETSADEAAMVASICADLGIPHSTLSVEVAPGNLQAKARAARYAALEAWLAGRGLDALATAHHADDQAETLLMRLNRASGAAGLAGVRARGNAPGGAVLVRPLFGWRKRELEEICKAAHLSPAVDPSNVDDRFDRTRVRAALATADWLDAGALAKSAAHLSDADEALDWAAAREWDECVEEAEGTIRYAPSAPLAIRLRVLARAIASLGGEPRGTAVAQLERDLRHGRGGNVAGVLARSLGESWELRREPPRAPLKG
ncbi:tRNA lysidine(34) synthetase TilS [Tsuneonella mangrovi]|uniref:tRNA lysidine(34) synthetase TilS n=1 Tax=Tsuneonella mangrovi TaxID=1982042 RepID=UPI000BA230D0|nr:tRNA lysidine(34) synthetase TilS [Tsuneonella mangrovi]